MITHYRRTATSPWVALPRMSRACFERFLMLGTYHSFKRDE